ncbi:hypothetical protein ACFW2E_20060, partial [Streptomyces sp. NPDC058964]
VVVPHKYFSPLPAAAPASSSAAAATPAPAASAPRDPVAAESVAAGSADVVDTTPGGLPRRRSRHRESEPEQPSRPAGRADGARVAAVPPDESFAGLAAFATAGRESTGPETATVEGSGQFGVPAAAGDEAVEEDTLGLRRETDAPATAGGRAQGLGVESVEGPAAVHDRVPGPGPESAVAPARSDRRESTEHRIEESDWST